MTGARYGLRHPAHAARITRHYRSLQGYVVLPVLLPLLGLAIVEIEGWGAAWLPWLAVASMMVSAVGAMLVSRWYRARFGLVLTASDVMPPQRIARRAVLFILVWAVASRLLQTLDLYAFLASGPWMLAALGLCFSWLGWSMRPLIPWTMATASLLAFLALTPLGRWPIFDGQHPFTIPGAQPGLMLLVGLIFAVEAHRALARALPEPAPEGSE